VIFFTRLLTLPMSEREMIVKYVDSGKPIIALRTANHGFHAALPYKINGKQVNWGNDVLGGTFMGHHGRWHADSTRGAIVPEHAAHPILTGVSDIWGNSDVYRTYKEGTSLPATMRRIQNWSRCRSRGSSFGRRVKARVPACFIPRWAAETISKIRACAG
jgi:hypothetical protein